MKNFYRRDPSKALSGMIGLSLEERGVYNTVLDLLYSTWRPLEDNRAFIAGWCGCAVQKLNPIIRRLIETGRLITFTEDGRTYVSDEAFESERKAVKGAAKTRSGRAEVEEKSGEVGEKSAGVEENPPTCRDEDQQNQPLAALEKRREEKRREIQKTARQRLSALPRLTGLICSTGKHGTQALSARRPRMIKSRWPLTSWMRGDKTARTLRRRLKTQP